MTQFEPLTAARQGLTTPLSVTEPWLDLEVHAERYEALSLLEQELREDGPPEEADETEKRRPPPTCPSSPREAGDTLGLSLSKGCRHDRRLDADDPA